MDVSFQFAETLILRFSRASVKFNTQLTFSRPTPSTTKKLCIPQEYIVMHMQSDNTKINQNKKYEFWQEYLADGEKNARVDE